MSTMYICLCKKKDATTSEMWSNTCVVSGVTGMSIECSVYCTRLAVPIHCACVYNGTSINGHSK